MTNTVLTDWFGLKDDRGGFKTTLSEDSSLLLGDPAWEKDVENIFEESELLDDPIRLVLWGGYGIGKTHRLMFMEHLIETKNEPYLVARCVCSDIDEKTEFSMLLEKILLSINLEKFHSLVRRFFQNEPPSEAFKKISNWVENPDIAKAYAVFDEQNISNPSLMKAWSFLLGRPLEGRDHESLGLTKKKLEHSQEFVDAIKVFSKILRTTEDKRLLIMVDEAENLGRLTVLVAQSKWRESLRYLLDDSNTGLIFTIGAEDQEEIPAAFASPDIIRRIQPDNYKVLDSISEIPDIEKFLQGLLNLVVDQGKLEAMKKSGDVPSSPSLNDQRYPFENDSTFNDFCQIIADVPADAKPSLIMYKMQKLAIAAKKDNSRLIKNVHLATIA